MTQQAVMNNKKRILIVAPPLVGHTNQLLVLGQELLERGYQVAFANSESFREKAERTGLEFILWDPELAITDPELIRLRNDVWERASREPSILQGERWMFDVVADSYPAMYKTLAPIFPQYRPDLVLVDSASVVAMDLAAHNRVPCVILAQFLGGHVKTDLKYPQYGTALPMYMNFKQRIQNRLHPWISLGYWIPPFRRISKYRKECGPFLSHEVLYYKSLMMVSTAFGVEVPRPTPPLIQMVGPIFSKNAEPLTPSLKSWLEEDGPNAKVVFMSFGTLATIEARHAKALVEGLSQAGVKVLFALRKDQHQILPPLPPNVRLETFVPQQAVLAHPAVKAVVSHCGMNSVSESLYRGKPILALPIFGDQNYNAARLCDFGVALKLSKLGFDAEEVKRKMVMILDDPSFTKRARDYSYVLQKTRGRETAADLTEIVMHVGVDHWIPELAYPKRPDAV